MNEITRIHLAKVPYDMEVSAKKQLETYLRTLEAHAEDADWLQDIEIRITEILEERGIQRGGLVTVADVAAIRAQLGEPEDFFEEGDIALDGERVETSKAPRRLYRDTSTAMLGGVLGGIAKFMKVDAVWVRLAFIVLLFISFGTAAIVYLVLWIVLPAATTAAAQLELAGQPVTLASLKNQRTKMGKQQDVSRAAQVMRTVLLYGAGTFAAVMAAISLVVTVWVGAGLAFSTSENTPLASVVAEGFAMWAALSLFVLSGLLLTALCVLVALICFRKKLTKAIGVAMIAIIVAGVISFGSAIGTVAYSSWQHTEALSASRHTKTVVLPAEFSQVKQLTITAKDIDGNWGRSALATAGIEYIVSPGAPRYELTVDSETAKVKPAIEITGGAAKVTLESNSTARAGFGFVQSPILKIYGPALETVTSEANSVSYSNTSAQESLALTADNGQLDVTGSFGAVSVETRNEGIVALNNASVDTLKASTLGGSIAAGVVKNLEVIQPESCPVQYDNESRIAIEVQAVTGGVFIYNGAQKPAETLKNACGTVRIGGEVDDLHEG